MNLINQTFQWTESVSVSDNDNVIFTYSRTKETKDMQFFEVKAKTSQMIEWSNLPVIRHSEFKVFVKGYTNYFGIKGKMLNINKWDLQDNNDVLYFEEHFNDSPYFPKYMTNNVSFDHQSKLFINTIDMNLSYKNRWDYSDKTWIFDGYTNFSSLGDGFEAACIMPSDVDGWLTKTAFITPGNSLEYEKTTNSAYLFAVGGDIIVNGIFVERDSVKKITSSNLTISPIENWNEDFVTVIIKESID